MQHHCKKATKRLLLTKLFSIIHINILVMFSPSYSCNTPFCKHNDKKTQRIEAVH